MEIDHHGLCTDLPISRNADSMFVVVDRFSKAIVITPCLKAITAEETSQLYLTMYGDELAYHERSSPTEALNSHPKL